MILEIAPQAEDRIVGMVVGIWFGVFVLSLGLITSLSVWARLAIFLSYGGVCAALLLWPGRRRDP